MEKGTAKCEGQKLLKRMHMSRKDRSQPRSTRAAAHLEMTLGTSHTSCLHVHIDGFH